MRHLATLLISCLLLSCGPGHNVVRVTVDSQSTVHGVSKLRITVTIGGRPSSPVDFSITNGPLDIPPAQTLALKLPADHSGAFTVSIDAIDANSKVIASGANTGQIGNGTERTDVTVLLGRGGALDGGVGDMGFSIAFAPTKVRGDGATMGTAVVVGRINSDQLDDLAIGGDGPARVFLTSSQVGFNEAIFKTIPSGYPLLGDVDSDGKLDLVTAAADHVSVLFGDGLGTFANPIDTQMKTGPSDLADMNGDGQLDFITVVNGSLSVLTGKANGYFNAPISITEGAVRIIARDVNADSKPDVLGVIATTLDVFLGKGDGSLIPPTQRFGIAANPMGLAIGDFDGNKTMDVVTAANDKNGVVILSGAGDGHFMKTQFYPTDLLPVDVAVADFDGDKKLDIAVSCAGTGNVSVLHGLGDGTFEAAQNIMAGPSPAGIATGDFNGDTKPDIVVTGGKSGNFYILVNYSR